MISPHAAARQRSLFLQSLEADRERRAKDLTEQERAHRMGRTPMAGDTILERLRATVRQTVQAHMFNGG